MSRWGYRKSLRREAENQGLYAKYQLFVGIVRSGRCGA